MPTGGWPKLAVVGLDIDGFDLFHEQGLICKVPGRSKVPGCVIQVELVTLCCWIVGYPSPVECRLPLARDIRKHSN